MAQLTQWLNAVNALVWGIPMVVLILGTGLYLQLRLGLLPLRKIGYGFRMIWQSRRVKEGQAGDISPYAALMTALSATVGTGNIAGVATAIAVGGPGALFWMWMTALVGMATKYAEVVLAVRFREQNAQGRWVGGPMYAIKNGLGPHWRWLGTAFAVFGGLAGFGIGAMVQSNGIATAMEGAFALPLWVSGVVLAALTAAVMYVLALSLAVFAFTTILGWAYYGEKCWDYLVGTRAEKPFRLAWVLAVFCGAVVTLDFAWLVADTLNALMAIPNLLSLLLLSPVIVQLTREYFSDQQTNN